MSLKSTALLGGNCAIAGKQQIKESFLLALPSSRAASLTHPQQERVLMGFVLAQQQKQSNKQHRPPAMSTSIEAYCATVHSSLLKQVPQGHPTFNTSNPHTTARPANRRLKNIV